MPMGQQAVNVLGRVRKTVLVEHPGPPGRRRRARAVRIRPLQHPDGMKYNKKRAAPERILPMVRPGGFEPLAFGVGEL